MTGIFDDHKYAAIAKRSVGGDLFNFDPERFAVPRAAAEAAAPEDLLARIDLLVEAYRGGDYDVKSDILEELLDMHAEGKLLWPVTAIFDGSVLEAVSTHAFTEAFEEHDPVFASVCQSLKDAARNVGGEVGADDKVKVREDKRIKRANADDTALICRFAVALRCATSARIDSFSDIGFDRLDAMMDVLRPPLGPINAASDWIACISTTWLRRGPKMLAEHLRDVEGDSDFTPAAMKRFGRKAPGRRGGYQHPPILRQYVLDFEKWIDEQQVMIKQRQGLRLFCNFFQNLSALGALDRSGVFDRESMDALLEFAKTWSTPPQRVVAINQLYAFTQSLVRDSREKRDSNPYNEALECHLDKIDVDRFVREQNASAPSKGAEVTARAMPMRFQMMLKEIIAEDDFAWPKSLKSKADGAPMFVNRWRNPLTGRQEDLFCPVIPRLLLLLLDIPLRNVQARRLDSGEGDARRYVASTGQWTENDSPHAHYWEKRKVKNPRRGVFREITTSDGGRLTGFWINSNKTQDRGNLFDETSGYEIPWQHQFQLENLSTMREWQETYNPVSGPLAHRDLPRGIFDDDPSKLVKSVLPARFYLFRLPGSGAPPSYGATNDFFLLALEELERRLNADNPGEPLVIITGRDSANTPYKALYTMHGLRAGTLTNLHLKGVGIEVLSKLVAGHASILMTLKYTKFDPRYVSEVLEDARIKVASDAWKEFPKVLHDASLEAVMRMTARIADDGVEQLKGAYSEPSCWLRSDIGICPNGATLCARGGEMIRRVNAAGIDKSVYAPVPGGSRNCVRCRFFLTGLPFLLPLWAKASSDMAKADALARDAASKENVLKAKKAERLRLSRDGDPIPPALTDEIAREDAASTQAIEACTEAFENLHATLALVEKVRAIVTHSAADGEGGGLPMLLGDDIPEIVGQESTRFAVVDQVVRASRLFPSLRSDDLERERDEFLNRVLYDNGYVPLTMSRLSEDEKRKAADAMAEMLLIRVGAEEVDNLIEGRKTLAEIGLQESLETACAHAIGSPLSKLGLMAPPSAPRLIELAAE